MSQAPSEGPFDAAGDALAEGPSDTRQIVLVKHGQRYVFRYSPGDESRILEDLLEMARDPESEIDWFDAAVLSHQMGRQFREQLSRLQKTT